MTRQRTIPGLLKRHGYWLVVAVPLLLPLSAWMGLKTGSMAFWAWFPEIALFVILPVIDVLIGRSPPPASASSDLKRLQTVVPLVAAGAFLVCLGVALWVVARWPGLFTPVPLVGWILSIGAVGGVAAINVAHELIHRRDPWLQRLGGLLLAVTWYPGFKVEHLRWHHVWVATHRDPASAPKGCSAWRQVPRALVLNPVRAWQLATERAARAGRRWPQLAHELTGWYALALAALGAIVSAWGVLAGLVFVGQGVAAAGMLELINYVEHYGLRRKQLPNGRFERPGIAHSWNADHWLSNAILLELQRHADHHLHPSRPFAELESVPEAPQLPLSYAALVPIALVPPLWRRVIHPHLPPRAVDSPAGQAG